MTETIAGGGSEAVSSPKKRRAVLRGSVLALPLVIYLLAFFIVPFVIVLVQSVTTKDGTSLANFVNQLASSVFWKAVLNTVVIALWSVVICGIVAVPFAYGLVTHEPLRNLMLALLFAPLVVNGVVRIFGLQSLLTLVNTILLGTGIIHTALPLNYSMIGIIIGFVFFQFPLMAISVYGSLSGVDGSLLNAARTLGAGRLQVASHVILPAALPGLLAGSILTFAAAAGSYILPAMMGGGRTLTLPQLVYSSVSANVDYAMGSALATLLVILIVPFLLLASSRQRAGGGSR
jgi:ABC-type spermidine/putrescine transport system permease subunit I